MMLMAAAPISLLVWMIAPRRASCPVTHPAIRLSAAVVAGGCTAAMATCAMVVSQHRSQLQRLHHRRRLRHLAPVPPGTQQRSTIATTRVARLALLSFAQNAAMDATSRQTQPRELTA